MSEFTVKGIIAKIESAETKTGSEFKKLTVFREDTSQIVKFNIFESQANLDQFKEGECLEFLLEENGHYTNYVTVKELADSEKLELTPEQKEELMVIHYEDDKPKTNTVYNKPKITPVEPEFIMLQGKKYVTHKGLLKVAHSLGLNSIVTELVSFVNNFAIMKSTVTMKNKSVFTCYGDANEDNVNKNIAKHLIRMAETRATNRALRLATNVGECSIEELGVDEDNEVHK